MIKRFVSVFLCLSIVSFCHYCLISASTYDLSTITSEELALYSKYPTKAAAAKICANKATTLANDRYKKYTHREGNGDACRHAYWSALMTRDIDKSFAYDAGLAHEGLTRDYSFSSQNADVKMDISNNYSGRTLGTQMSTSTDSQLAYAVTENVNGGNLKRIRVYTSNASENDETINGVMTKYVGYYVATSSGGYISSSTK